MRPEAHPMPEPQLEVSALYIALYVLGLET
jgi:hypothetical protein